MNSITFQTVKELKMIDTLDSIKVNQVERRLETDDRTKT